MLKKKSLSARYPVLFSIMLVLIVLLITSIDIDQNALGGKDFALSRIVVIIGLLLLMRNKGFFSINKGRPRAFWGTFFWGSPLILLGIGSVLLTNWESFSGQAFPAFSDIGIFTWNMFLVGTVEELLYRGVVFNSLYQKYEKKRKGILCSVLVSAIIFGSVHLVNLPVFPLLNVGMQVINATCSGVLFATLYWKKQNLLGLIIVHTVTNFFALFPQVLFPNATSIVTASLSVSEVCISLLAGAGVPLLTAYFLIRKTDSVS